MAEREEALVVCGEKMSAGITMWDLGSGDVLLRVPNCASPTHGLLCLHNKKVLVASQLPKDRPFAGGAIFFWSLNKQPQVPKKSYPLEAIGPIASSNDCVYLAGGTTSGSAYIWEVTSGRMLKNLQVHHKSVSCLAFSHDDSFLISGSEDGCVSIWSMISVLDIADPQVCKSLPSFCNWSEHESNITALLPLSSISSSALISSSLDGTCKVWDLLSGSLMQNHIFSVAITATAVDPGEQHLFAGGEDGKIYVNALHLGLQGNQNTVSEYESRTLCGHKGSITALTFSLGGSRLISASEDRTCYLWNVANWQIIHKFSHEKGPHVSLLDKAPQPDFTYEEGTLTSLLGSQGTHILTDNFQSSLLLNKQTLCSEKAGTPEQMQMRIDTSVQNRLWILNMTKHVNNINRHLRARIVDMMQYRLCCDDPDAPHPRRAETDDDLGE